MMDLAWWVEFLWLLFMHPNPYSELSGSKRERLVNQHRKSVPRYIMRIFFSKNKVPIYAYSAQLNIFTSYWLTVLYASVIVRKIFDDDDVNYLGVMTKISWYTHLIFSILYKYVAKRPPIPPDTLLLEIHGSLCLT